MYRPRRSTRPTPGSSATSSDSALACRARRRAAASPMRARASHLPPSPNPPGRAPVRRTRRTVGTPETDRDRVPSPTSPRSFHPSRVAPPRNLRATRCPPPRRLIARIPPPPPPPRVPLGESQPPGFPQARGTPSPREAHRWASSRGSARRRTRCTGRTALGRREAETRPTTRRDRRTREPRERRRRADTRESRRGWSLERSREARRDAFPGRARASRPLPRTESREHSPGAPREESARDPRDRRRSRGQDWHPRRVRAPSRGPWVPSSL